MAIFYEWEEEQSSIVEHRAVSVAHGGGTEPVTETQTVTRRLRFSNEDTPEMVECAEGYLVEFAQDHPGARIVTDD